jgi:F0F1-type ATP synthase assembly protein I
MPTEEKPSGADRTPGEKKARKFAENSALALELPFTLVGAMAIGVAIGYLADRWLHTRPVLMIILGGLGFVAGLREVLRRLPAS